MVIRISVSQLRVRVTSGVSRGLGESFWAELLESVEFPEEFLSWADFRFSLSLLSFGVFKG